MELEIIERLSGHGSQPEKDTVGGEPPAGSARRAAPAAEGRFMQPLHDSSGHDVSKFGCMAMQEGDPGALFVGRGDGYIIVWKLTQRNQYGGSSLASRREEVLETDSPHQGAVTSLAHDQCYSEHSDSPFLLASGGVDHTVKIWDPWMPRKVGMDCCVQTISSHEGTVLALAFSFDGSLLTGSRDGTVILWKRQSGRRSFSMPFFYRRQKISLGRAWSVWPTAIATVPSEEWLIFVGDSEGSVHVYQRQWSLGRRDLEDSEDEPAPESSRNGGRAAELSLLKQFKRLHALSINSLTVVAEHNFLLSCSRDGACHVVDYARDSIFFTVREPQRGAQPSRKVVTRKFSRVKSDAAAAAAAGPTFVSCAWSLAHEQMVLCDSHGGMEVWSAYTGKCLLNEQVAHHTPPSGPRRGEGAAGLAALYLSQAEGRCFVLSPAECCVLSCVIRPRLEDLRLPSHSDLIVDIACTGESLVVSASADNSVHAWDLLGERETWAAHIRSKSEITCFSLLPGGAGFVAGTEEGSVHFWSLTRAAGNAMTATQRDCRRLPHSNSVSALKIVAGSGRCMMASVDFDGNLAFWVALEKDRASADPASELYALFPQLTDHIPHAHASEIICLEFCGKEGLLATGGNDGVVRLWQFGRKTAVAELRGHADAVQCLSWDQGQRQLLSGGNMGEVLIWLQACAGSHIFTKVGLLEGHSCSVDHCIITSDGCSEGIITCSGENGDILLWQQEEQQQDLLNTANEEGGDGGGDRPQSGLYWKIACRQEYKASRVTSLACAPGGAGSYKTVFAGCENGEIMILRLLPTTKRDF
jgi:WD40 repeat protein